MYLAATFLTLLDKVNMLHILLVEDDYDLASTVVDYFSMMSISCDHTNNGISALQLIDNNLYQCVILDINIPRLNGIDVCKQLRDKGKDIPILMLTAKDQLDDKLLGFDAGTDDYLVKPFELKELTARIKALSKRKSGQVNKLQFADLNLDIESKQAYRGTHSIKLSPIAFKLLETLMRASPNPVSRESLIQTVWGDDSPDSNSLKVHMHNLRKQINLPSSPKLIHTITGFGFAIKETYEDTP